MTDREQGPVTLVPVDERVLGQLVQAAITDATADDVTPPLSPGPGWTPARVEWLERFHRDRRAGLSGRAGELTWAVVAHGQVVGSVRLRRTEDRGVMEIGVWLTRTARGQGIGTSAMAAVLTHAAALDTHEVRADTTAGNLGAVRVLRRLGFALTQDPDGSVRATIRLAGEPSGP